MSSSLRVQSTVNTTAELAARAGIYASGLLIARRLPPHDFGTFMAALAYVQIVFALVDAGMGPLAAREIASGRDGHYSFASQLLSWRMVVGVVTILATLAFGKWLFPSADIARSASWLLPLYLGLKTAEYASWVLKGRRDFLTAAVVLAVPSAVLFGTLLSLPHLNQLTDVAIAYSSAALAAFAITLWKTGRQPTMLRMAALDLQFFGHRFHEIYRLGIITVLCVLFSRIDLLIASRFLSAQDIGLYACALQIIEAFALISSALYGVAIPTFASSIHNRRECSERCGEFLTITTFTTAGFIILSPFVGSSLVKLLFGAGKAGATLPYSVLLYLCPILFVAGVFQALLFSTDHTRDLVSGLLLGIILNVLLVVFLAPIFGAQSLSWSRLAATATTTFYWTRRSLRHGAVEPAIVYRAEFFLLAVLLASLAAGHEPWEHVAGFLVLCVAFLIYFGIPSAIRTTPRIGTSIREAV